MQINLTPGSNLFSGTVGSGSVIIFDGGNLRKFIIGNGMDPGGNGEFIAPGLWKFQIQGGGSTKYNTTYYCKVIVSGYTGPNNPYGFIAKFYDDGNSLVADVFLLSIEGEMDKSNVVGISRVSVDTGLTADLADGTTYDVKCQFCMY